MMRIAFIAAFIMMAVYGVTAQFPPPVPIVEQDLRDNTIRMRSVELERIKRESRKTGADPSLIRANLDLAQVKADFEKIQKLQDSILTRYTNGASLSAVAKLAKGIRNDSRRLMLNLFGEEATNAASKGSEPSDVRSLIIRLDNAIGRFVGNPIFQNQMVVQPDDARTAQEQLGDVVKLSGELYLKARKSK